MKTEENVCALEGCSQPLVAGVNSSFCSIQCEQEASRPDECYYCGRDAEEGETFETVEAELNGDYPDGKLTPISICSNCEIPQPKPAKPVKVEKLPKVKLTGTDSNAFSVIGLCVRAAKKAGWTQERIKAFREEAMGGDYYNVLGTAMKHFDVR